MKLRLHADLDMSSLAAEFARAGRIRIRPFLDEAVAAALHGELREVEGWRQVLNSGEKVFELDRATRAGMAPAQREALDEAVRNGARYGFQYRYETIRLSDGDVILIEGDRGLISRIPQWLSSDEPREMLRSITGFSDIVFADGQATAYSPGDFLTGHDDLVRGKNRRAAYVLGMTPTWRTEWGGLLLFHDDDGAVRGYCPGYNSIDVFAVGQTHSVSSVTAFAAYRRYAITGWLRGPRLDAERVSIDASGA